MQTNPSDINVDVRYQSILIVWFAIFMSISLYFLLIWMTPKPPDPEKFSLALILSAISILPVAISFFVKSIILTRAAETQNLAQVQQAYVLALALCEVAVLLGVLAHFLAGSSYYVVPRAIGAAGILLHFPRRKHLLDATYKPL